MIDYQVAANRTEAARLNKLIAEYQAKIDVVPTRESELVELTRDYSTMQAAYTNLLVKREDAMLAANLERRQIGEQFKLLDTASMPGRAVQSDAAPRHHEFRRDRGPGDGPLADRTGRVSRLEFPKRREALEVLSVPVLALIPVMSSDREVARRDGGRG